MCVKAPVVVLALSTMPNRKSFQVTGNAMVIQVGGLLHVLKRVASWIIKKDAIIEPSQNIAAL